MNKGNGAVGQNLKFFKNMSLWSVPSAAETLAKAIVTAVAISILSKENFGYVSLGMLIFSYMSLLSWGSTDALMLNLPEKNVRGEHKIMVDEAGVALYIVTASQFLLEIGRAHV